MLCCASKSDVVKDLSPVSTTRVDGWPVSIARQHGPCWWVMETGHPSTRAVNSGVNSGSGNPALKLEDKDNNLWSEEKDKDLKSYRTGRGTRTRTCINWSSRILEDKNFPEDNNTGYIVIVTVSLCVDRRCWSHYDWSVWGCGSEWN